MFKDKTYRLQDVVDHNGTSKTGGLYINRIGCVTSNIHKLQIADDGCYVLCMDFTQDHAGNPIKKSLRTSPVQGIIEENCTLEVQTQNSVYIFEEAELVEHPPLDEANLIELYLCDEGYQFCTGYYYDENKCSHKLHEYVHVGLFRDSVLVYLGNDVSDTVCRYFPLGRTIEFYDTLYHQRLYALPILIHNQGCKSLTIRFQGQSQSWIIDPFDSERIVSHP